MAPLASELTHYRNSSFQFPVFRPHGAHSPTPQAVPRERDSSCLGDMALVPTVQSTRTQDEAPTGCERASNSSGRLLCAGMPVSFDT